MLRGQGTLRLLIMSKARRTFGPRLALIFDSRPLFRLPETSPDVSCRPHSSVTLCQTTFRRRRPRILISFYQHSCETRLLRVLKAERKTVKETCRPIKPQLRMRWSQWCEKTTFISDFRSTGLMEGSQGRPTVTEIS
jgi:hypothetical protein